MQDSTRVAAPGYFSKETIHAGEPGLYDPASNLSRPTSYKKTGPFITHKAIVSDQEPLPQTAQSDDWFFWILLAGVLILASLKHLHEKRIGLLFRSVLSRSAAAQITREGSVMQHQSFLLLIGLALISYFLFLYQVVYYFAGGQSPGKDDLVLAMQILGGITGFMLLKIGFVHASGIIFNNRSIAADYAQNIIIFNLVSGIVLVPFLFLIAYWDQKIFIFIASGLLLLLLVVRFIRGFLIGASDMKFSLFHLFLYLCTLEILPIVFIAKFFSSSFFS